MGTGRAALVAVAALMAAQLFSVSDGHVALTFPLARRFDLDFLDNFRTKAPCGMPKGKIARRRRRSAKAIEVKSQPLFIPFRELSIACAARSRPLLDDGLAE